MITNEVYIAKRMRPKSQTARIHVSYYNSTKNTIFRARNRRRKGTGNKNENAENEFNGESGEHMTDSIIRLSLLLYARCNPDFKFGRIAFIRKLAIARITFALDNSFSAW